MIFVRRVKSWLLAGVMLTVPAMPAMAGGEHSSTADGPLTALARLSSTPALAEAQARRLGLDHSECAVKYLSVVPGRMGRV